MKRILFILTILMTTQSIAQESTYYKGNLHTHSLWSDGNDYPEMICKWYKENGYHFLALSDHNILSEGKKWIDSKVANKRGAAKGLERYRKAFGNDWVETKQDKTKTLVRLKPLNEFRSLFEESGKFLLIQGEEITDHFERKPIHINATNLRDLIKPQGGKSVRETMSNNLKAIKRQSDRVQRPILAHLNHPNFGYAITAEDMAHVLEEKFFEVYNGHPSVNHRGDKQHAGLERMWDIANTIRIAKLDSPPLYGIATDDSHNYFGVNGSSPGRGWVMVNAKRLSPEALIHSLEDGDFYASSGVELKSIRYDQKTKTLSIEVKPQGDETYETKFIGTLKGYDDSSKPATEKQGQASELTRIYSKEVGQILATSKGLSPSYKLTGKELYVRATITSSKEPFNPVFNDQKQQAWTQPIGWAEQIGEAKSKSKKED